MKNRLSQLSILVTAAILLITACKKSGSDNDDSSFTWNYKGVDYKANYTLARSVPDVGANIVGGLGNSALTPGSGPSFNIIPLNTGLYVVGPGENFARFIDTEGNDRQAVGLITISSIANKKLSATFTLQITDPSGSHTLTGVINKIPITP